MKQKKLPQNDLRQPLLLILKPEFILKIALKLRDRHAHLLHGIAVADGHCVVSLGIEVICDAERSADLVLPSVTFSDVAPVVKLAVVLFAELGVNLLRALL